MSTVTYKLGSKEYTFESRLQLRNISLIAVEENLNEEVKIDIHRRKNIGHLYPQDISLVDDNGITAYAESFQNINNLKILTK